MLEQYRAAIELFTKFLGTCNHDYSGEQLKFNCPNCAKLYNEYKPDGKFNLEINLKSKSYHCWKCEIKGLDIKYLIKIYARNEMYIEQYENIFIFERFEKFFRPSNENNDENSLFDIVTLPTEFIPFKSDKFDEYNFYHLEAYDYLKEERKISDEDILNYNIGFCLTGRYKNRIIFPSYDINYNINYFITRTYVNNKIKYLNPEIPRLNIIINEKNLSFNDTLYIVEGFFDYLAFPLNTSILLEKKISDLLLDKIIKYKPNLVFLLDPDALKDMYNAIDKLQNYGFPIDRIKFVKFDDVDIDEYKRLYGTKSLIKKISEMEPIDKFFSLKKEKYYINALGIQ